MRRVGRTAGETGAERRASARLELEQSTVEGRLFELPRWGLEGSGTKIPRAVQTGAEIGLYKIADKARRGPGPLPPPVI